MNQQPRLSFVAVTPRLPVDDVEKLLTFYTQGLGFELGWKWGDPVTHANVCRGDVGFDLIRVTAGCPGTAMAFVQVDGVDAYHAELMARNLDLSGIADRPYGMRDFEVVDPCGNRIAFGQPLT